MAATDNLALDYANSFELVFYNELAKGSFISDAFRTAVDKCKALMCTKNRSGQYDPMFLDLKVDTRFIKLANKQINSDSKS